MIESFAGSKLEGERERGRTSLRRERDWGESEMERSLSKEKREGKKEK